MQFKFPVQKKPLEGTLRSLNLNREPAAQCMNLGWLDILMYVCFKLNKKFWAGFHQFNLNDNGTSPSWNETIWRAKSIFIPIGGEISKSMLYFILSDDTKTFLH